MNWFLIALGATFLWALSNIVDEFIVKKYSIGKRGSGGLVLFTCFMGVFMAVVVGLLTKGLFQIPLSDKLLLIFTGGITIGWIILYLYTLETEDISSVVPWFLTIPVFGYILGFIFLGETLNLHQWIGSIIILIGMSIILIDFGEEKRSFRWEPFRNMMIACFMVAVSGVIFKYVTVEGNFWVSSFWEYVGLGILGTIMYFLVPKYRHQFHLMNKEGGYKIFFLNTLSEVTTIGGNLLTNFAMLLVPVTMVYLVGSFQPAIVLILTLIATKFFPHITKENMNKHILLPKIIAIIVMIAGSVFLLI
ncbi:DMT family transporter [Candidatus Nomurabacteria bacterium]|nr:DMT family transporter [Candidatus Nomurabacteria bacterium]